MSRYYDSDGERIDAPSRAEALADAIALGDLEPSVTPEQVAEWREGYERALRDERVERVLTVWTDRYPHDDKVAALARQVRNALGEAS